MNKNWNIITRTCNIGPHFAEASLEKASLLPEELIEEGKKWLRCPRYNLILKGNVGSGKSYFLHSLAHAIADKGGHPIVWNSAALDQKMLDAMYGRGIEQSIHSIIRTLSEADFLFVDDLGLEMDGDRTRRQYYSIINGRYENNRVWVVSTNCPFEELEEKFGARTASRLSLSLTLEFPERDLRKDINIFEGQGSFKRIFSGC